MANSVLEGPTQPRSPMLDGELDLRPIINTLVRWWKEIVAITAIVVLATVGLFKFQESRQVPIYVASASVAMVRTVSSVEFDERFRTVPQEGVNPGDWANTTRRNSLVGLVRNAAIADRVLAEIGDQLPEEQRSAGALLGRVWAEPVIVGEERSGASDLIRISASGATPEDATLLANAWARAYVEIVNSIYGQVPNELVESVQRELTAAQAQYNEAQKALEAFVATTQRDDINRAIVEKQEILDNLRRGRTTAISVMVDEAVKSRQQVISAYLSAQTRNSLAGFNLEQETERALLAAYINAMSRAQLEVFNQQAESRADQLAHYYREKERNARLLDNARALRRQLEEGGESALATSAISLQVLKLQAFTRLGESNYYLQPVPSTTNTQVISGTAQVVATTTSAQIPVTSSPPPVGLPVDVSRDITLEEATTDLQALITTLEARLAELDERIQTLSAELLSGDGYDLLNTQVPDESQLMSAIAELYPQLFEPGTLAEMSENIASDTGLSAAAREKAIELLELTELSDLVDFSTADQPLTQAVAKLSDEIQALQGALAAENARERELTQVRDLAWETLKALQNKVAELNLTRAAASSEVRLAAPAIPPSGPVPGESITQPAIISLAAGLTLALVTAFLAEFLGKRPFFEFGSRQAEVPASSRA